MNINAAKGLQDVLKTNLGPKGTIKMYSSASSSPPFPSLPLSLASPVDVIARSSSGGC